LTRAEAVDLNARLDMLAAEIRELSREAGELERRTEGEAAT
jgi:hypothetical protein